MSIENVEFQSYMLFRMIRVVILFPLIFCITEIFIYLSINTLFLIP